MSSVTSLSATVQSFLALVTLVAACSPDLSLLNDGASFGGVDAGGEEDTGDPLPSGGEGGVPPAGGAAGLASGGTAPGCAPSGAESCNGHDDDCNGTVDDGCPSVTTTFEKDLTALGDSAGGAVFSDDCEHGQVLGGVSVRMGSFLAQVQGICRTLELKPNVSAELGYELALNGEIPLAAHPEAGQDTQTALPCPENEALVGLRISQQYATLSDGSTWTVIPSVWLSCAKLVLVKQAGDALGVEWDGLKEQAPASGSIADGTAWFVSATAPQGFVASRLLGASGSWVDRLGIGVSRIDIVKAP